MKELCEIGGGGCPFMVVEFLSGGTLADRLSDGPVPAPEAVAISANLAEAPLRGVASEC